MLCTADDFAVLPKITNADAQSECCAARRKVGWSEYRSSDVSRRLRLSRDRTLLDEPLIPTRGDALKVLEQDVGLVAPGTRPPLP